MYADENDTTVGLECLRRFAAGGRIAGVGTGGRVGADGRDGDNVHHAGDDSAVRGSRRH